jgi:hypothetical protein
MPLDEGPGFTGHPLYVVVDILVFIWEAFWTILEIHLYILQILAGF